MRHWSSRPRPPRYCRSSTARRGISSPSSMPYSKRTASAVSPAAACIFTTAKGSGSLPRTECPKQWPSAFGRPANTKSLIGGAQRHHRYHRSGCCRCEVVAHAPHPTTGKRITLAVVGRESPRPAAGEGRCAALSVDWPEPFGLILMAQDYEPQSRRTPFAPIDDLTWRCCARERDRQRLPTCPGPVGADARQ